MLAKNATRRLTGAWRRSFSTNASLKKPSTGNITSTSASGQNSRWSGRSVFALSASAGVLGFGLAAIALPNSPPKRAVTLFDSKASGPKYASMDEMEIALKEIRHEIKRFGEDEDILSTDPEDLYAHGYSEWSTVNPDGLPVAVAYPRSTEHVSIIARICHKYHVPIIPYSGGSSLEGHFSAPYGGISVDFAYMVRSPEIFLFLFGIEQWKLTCDT
ncbi:hypothetical protein F5Y19DRAFT_156608 [Xylariaceae sp. FL1651]|nr:hypothetical protein F5Y19DRAFT_156608 [Xylariaceae sp. FL1651]